jgi:putative peptide zinc metalloprotease protein
MNVLQPAEMPLAETQAAQALSPGTPPDVPVLMEGVHVLPFDSSSVQKRYLLVRRDGRRWHISAYLAAVIAAIDGRQDADGIAAAVSGSLGRPVQRADIERVLDGFLAANEIVERPTSADWSELRPVPVALSPARRSSTTLRVPLLWGRPLALVTRAMAWLFRRPFAWPLVCAMVGFQMVWGLTHLQAIGMATHSSWTGDVVVVLGLVMVSLVLHEFGHASACRAFGAKEGEIGFAIYLVFPVFYCDVTDAWKLSRRQRAALDLAGLYVQGLFATLMLGSYLVSRRDLFLWTFLAISASYIPNLNPFLKMDGYWFLSDMLGVANLSQRVGELLRGDRSTLRAMSRTMATLTYLYLVASTAYMAGFFYWVGRYAIALLRGGYLASLRNVQVAFYGDFADMLPALLAVLASTVILIFLPFLGWRTLRGCLAWIRDVAEGHRRQRVRKQGTA